MLNKGEKRQQLFELKQGERRPKLVENIFVNETKSHPGM